MIESTHRRSQLLRSRISSWVNQNPGFRLRAYRTAGQNTSRHRMNSPCNSSTALLNSSRTCNIPHHGVVPDRNQVTIVGVKLPAFQLSMNVFFRFHRNAPGSLELIWRDLPADLLTSASPSSAIFGSNKCPKNKKPGVERRAQPPLGYSGSARSSTKY